MLSPAERRLRLYLRQYDDASISPAYLAVYRGSEPAPRAFASIHERLDEHLRFLNTKAPNGKGGHFNADDSRSLLALIEEIAELRKSLRLVGKGLVLRPEYERTLAEATHWLQPLNGSTVPEGITPVEVDPFSPMMDCDGYPMPSTVAPVELKMVGEGAFATVHKFVEPTYGITLARKKLKDGVQERERARFRDEFALMKELKFPYILEVYRFDETNDSYIMEYCDTTLGRYIKARNNQELFGFQSRKRIALQFLYGLNYIHSKGHCHRDLSVNNVLLRVYTESAVVVKLSDFGLAKRDGSDYTHTDTELNPDPPT